MSTSAGALLAPHANREYAIGLARAFGGAILFAFPLLMTMEMWWLGLYLERDRLLLFVLLNFALLAGLSYYTGFEQAEGAEDIVMDALTAFGVGAIASAAVLASFGLLTSAMSADEIVGKIALQAIPASIGAAVARKQLTTGDESEQQRERKAGYFGQLFLMAAGAVFLSFNVAPTEEMMLIAFKMTPWHAISLVLFSIVLLHAFVYRVGFAGQEQRPEGAGFTRTFLLYTVTGYAMALVVSLYVLWTLGRMDDTTGQSIVAMTVVLGFPASLGAAIARLIV
jgi:putative integral membrane protein (TIGR02587 family)